MGRRNVTEPEPVEDSDLVGAVVGAVPGPDAPVVDLGVQTLRGVVRRVDRANRLTWRVAAVLTDHGEETNVHRPGLAGVHGLVVPLHPDPVHVPPHGHLLFTHPGDVVLRLAGGNADTASGAFVQVDGHGPTGVLFRIVLAVAAPLQGEVFRPSFREYRGETSHGLDLFQLPVVLPPLGPTSGMPQGREGQSQVRWAGRAGPKTPRWWPGVGVPGGFQAHPGGQVYQSPGGLLGLCRKESPWRSRPFPWRIGRSSDGHRPWPAPPCLP